MQNEITRISPSAEVRVQLNRMQEQFAAALPAHIPVERFVRVVMTAVQGAPILMTASRQSLFSSAMKAAQDGLLPDGREAALVEYKGQVQYLPMIAGLRKKVRNSGEISTWDVHAVYEGDVFEFELGDDPFIKHRPTLANRGKIVAVYSVAKLKDGSLSRDVMSVEDVEKIRAKSRAQKGPWSDPAFYPEMAKKTVARRHSKVLPMSTDLDDLLRRDDDLYDFQAAKDEAAALRGPANLADRMAALTDRTPPHDPETGEIHEDAAEDEHAEEAAAASDAPMADAAPEAPAASVDVEQARELGRAARLKGVPRRAIPADVAANESSVAAWTAGFDEAKGDRA